MLFCFTHHVFWLLAIARSSISFRIGSLHLNWLTWPPQKTYKTMRHKIIYYCYIVAHAIDLLVCEQNKNTKMNMSHTRIYVQYILKSVIHYLKDDEIKWNELNEKRRRIKNQNKNAKAEPKWLKISRNSHKF